MPAKKDLTNLRVGRLTVLYETDERRNGKIVWHCKCDCGKEVDIIGTSLTNKTRPTQSCGCLQKENTSKANSEKGLENQIFGKLKVIERIDSKWKCQCDCGNIAYVSTNHLKSGHTQSCGCLQREKTIASSAIDITNQRYGLLVALKYDELTSIPKKRKWICKCDCGNIVSVELNNLRSGDTQSCGCTKMSHGEIAIKQLLEENNIFYQQEYAFPSCKNPKTNKSLRFDFYINNEYLIEFDGIQHYKDTHTEKWGEPLEETQYKDKIKNDWCEKNNIPLIRIPYWKLKTLTIEDLLLK